MITATILLVDDDPDDLAIITEAIKETRADIQVLSALNGELALQMLDRNPHLQSNLCLIILDLNMPKMNGTQTLMALKADQRFEKIPVVIYSTSENSLEKEKCLMLGAHSYMTKPLSYRESIQTAAFFVELCEVHEM